MTQPLIDVPVDTGHCYQCGQSDHRFGCAVPRPASLLRVASFVAWDALEALGVPSRGPLTPTHAASIREVIAVLQKWEQLAVMTS